ncbi:MAG: carbohydrate ABC transporter permease [Lachnospiraceae bacterium]
MKGIRKKNLTAHMICILAVTVFMYPIVLMLIKSFAVDGIYNYVRVFETYRLFKNLVNSILIVFTTLIVVAVVVSLAAYAFSKLEFPFKKMIYYAMLMGMMIPASAMIFPLFSTIKGMGMLGSRFSVVLPYATLSSCFNLMMLKNYFDALPDQMIEAARIDGAGNFRVFRTVMMPLAKPGLAFVLMQTFLSSWNELQMAMIFIKDEAKLPISVIPIRFSASMGSTQFPVQVLFAALVICLLPIAIFYLFASRFLIAGLTQGAVKG